MTIAGRNDDGPGKANDIEETHSGAGDGTTVSEVGSDGQATNSEDAPRGEESEERVVVGSHEEGEPGGDTSEELSDGEDVVVEAPIAVVSGEEKQGPKARAVGKGGDVEVTIEEASDKVGMCTELNSDNVEVGREGSGVVERQIETADGEEAT